MYHNHVAFRRALLLVIFHNYEIFGLMSFAICFLLCANGVLIIKEASVQE